MVDLFGYGIEEARNKTQLASRKVSETLAARVPKGKQNVRGNAANGQGRMGHTCWSNTRHVTVAAKGSLGSSDLTGEDINPKITLPCLGANEAIA